MKPQVKLIKVKRGALDKSESPMLAILTKYTAPLAHVDLLFGTGFHSTVEADLGTPHVGQPGLKPASSSCLRPLGMDGSVGMGLLRVLSLHISTYF